MLVTPEGGVKVWVPANVYVWDVWALRLTAIKAKSDNARIKR